MSTLKINRYFLEEPNIDVTKRDYTIIGLVKDSPKYEKGRKISASYFSDNEKEDLVIMKTFTDIKEEGKLVKLKIDHNFYNEEGEIGTHTTTYIDLNIAEVATLERKRRNRAIDFLRASSVGTPIENYVTALLKHYKEEIDLYIYNNTSDFQNSINNESEAPYINYLNIIIEGPSTEYPSGKKVKDSILEQIQ